MALFRRRRRHRSSARSHGLKSYAHNPKHRAKRRRRDPEERDWKGHKASHRKAAKKGWATRKRRKSSGTRASTRSHKKHRPARRSSAKSHARRASTHRRVSHKRKRATGTRKRRSSMKASHKRRRSKRDAAYDYDMPMRDRGWKGDKKRHRMAASMGWHKVARKGWKPAHPKYKGDLYKTAGTTKRGRHYLSEVTKRSGAPGYKRRSTKKRRRDPEGDASYGRDFRRVRHHRTYRHSRFGYQ